MSQTSGASRSAYWRQLGDDLVDRDRAAVVDLREHLVLVLERALDLLGQDLLVEDVLDPDADAVHLVGVRRPDAAAGGADPPAAQEALGHLVEAAVVVGDDVRVGADLQPAGVEAAGLECVDLLEEHVQVDDDAVADDRRAARGEDAAGQQVQGVLLVADDDGVAGVVAAVELHDVVDPVAQEVGRLALALVAPLGADDRDRGHLSPPVVECCRGPRHREAPAQVPGALAASRYQSAAVARPHPRSRVRVRAMDPLLVITNRDAGTSDEESLEAALEVLRERTSVEVHATGDPGELDGVLHRAGSRRIVVAGGDGSLHAVIAGLYKRHDLGRNVLGLLPLGTGNDFARGVGLPLDIEEAARVLLDGTPTPDGPDRRRGRQGGRQQRARRGGRPGEQAGDPLEGAPRLGRRRQGQPRQARLPDRRRHHGLEPAPAPAPGRDRRRGRQRPRPPGAPGGGRQRLVGRWRNRADTRRRARGRAAGRDDLARGRADGPGRCTPCGWASPPTRSTRTSTTTALPRSR